MSRRPRATRSYIAALEECGLEVTVLDADERYPDSVFIEDTAVVTDRCAIVTNPERQNRRGEVHEVEKALSRSYGNVERIIDPGTWTEVTFSRSGITSTSV